jgi:hypothetical protein
VRGCLPEHSQNKKRSLSTLLVNCKYCKGEMTPCDVFCHGLECHAFIDRSSCFAIATADLPSLQRKVLSRQALHFYLYPVHKTLKDGATQITPSLLVGELE